MKKHLPEPHFELKGNVEVLPLHPHWLLEKECRYMILLWDSISRRTLKGFGQEHPVPESFMGSHRGTVGAVGTVCPGDSQKAPPEGLPGFWT